MVYKKNAQGFTIVEAIIVTAVLAAVTVMAFPNFVEFFRMQEETMEETAMSEIKNALAAYADDNGQLPGAGTWAADLAPYSSLSQQAIAIDQWEQPRAYRKISSNETYRSATVNIDYAVVYGHGPERGLGDSGVNVNLSASLTSVSDYSSLKAEFGDYMVKYTNYKEQIRNYEITEQRLKDISAALSSYATTRFNEAVVGGTGTAEEIYYPPSEPADISSPVADTADYNNTVEAELDNFYPSGTGNRISTDESDDALRKQEMEYLMRFLGLPDTHCCSALDANETAFFYYSNPRPRLPGPSCGTRPTTSQRKLPPRVRVEHDDCG
ncbi:MAG: hypothetical protein CMF60_05790 [Magnetococcales bacterium]|nr:hypothetical protein [Magnetococcales bacterium]